MQRVDNSHLKIFNQLVSKGSSRANATPSDLLITTSSGGYRGAPPQGSMDYGRWVAGRAPSSFVRRASAASTMASMSALQKSQDYINVLHEQRRRIAKECTAKVRAPEALPHEATAWHRAQAQKTIELMAAAVSRDASRHTAALQAAQPSRVLATTA